MAGYSADSVPEGFGSNLGEILLAVHQCYLPAAEPFLTSGMIRGMSHITGGGLEGNTKRILPAGTALDINWQAWERPAVYQLIQEKGGVDEADMRRTFNLGIGWVFITRSADSDKLYSGLADIGEKPILIGRIV